MRHALLSASFLASAAVGTPRQSAAQVTTLDEGRFVVMRGGQRVGTEDFQIRRTVSPGGAVVVATATVAYDQLRLSPALRTDSAGAPLAYQLEVREGPLVKENLSGQVGRGRFSARLRSPSGESVKEYIVGTGALVLDDQVFHQYYFLGQGVRAGSVPVVIPRRNVQVTMRVEDRGSEPVTVGGTTVQARHVVLSDPEGGARHVWFDGAGRVLRVTLEQLGLTATRDELPR